MALNPQTLQAGQEQYEYYKCRVSRKRLCQYDYRATDGELFSCVKPTLTEAREACAKWLLAR